MAGDRPIIAAIAVTAVALAVTYSLYRALRKSSQKLIGSVKELYIYPIKSCAGVKLNAADCCIDGLKWDRRWVLIDESHTFVTIRDEPSMALIRPTIVNNQLKITAPDMPLISVPIELKNCVAVETKIWRTNITGLDCGKEVGEWFSKYLNKPNCKLLFKPNELPNRYLKDDSVWSSNSRSNDQCAFADVTSYHLTFTASLKVLNSKASRRISMGSFRPNIIVESEEPYVEDQFKYYYIDNVILRKVKDTERCLRTTVDPDTGIMDPVQEPLKTMRTFRPPTDPRQKTNPLFGINTAIDRMGPIAIGSSVFAA